MQQRWLRGRRFYGPGMYPDGAKPCWWCERPTSNRRHCSYECVRAYRIASDPIWMRAAVARRDNGICRSCGLDCAAIDNALVELAQRDAFAAMEEATKLGLTYAERGEVRIRSAWDVDHVIALEHGGDNVLSNLSTACRSCHFIKTRRERHNADAA